MVSIPIIIEHRVSKEGFGREGIKPQKGLSMGEIHLILPCIGHPGGFVSRACGGRRGAGRRGGEGGRPLEKGTMWSYS
jgi:hypothetical protein